MPHLFDQQLNPELHPKHSHAFGRLQHCHRCHHKREKIQERLEPTVKAVITALISPRIVKALGEILNKVAINPKRYEILSHQATTPLTGASLCKLLHFA